MEDEIAFFGHIFADKFTIFLPCDQLFAPSKFLFQSQSRNKPLKGPKGLLCYVFYDFRPEITSEVGIYLIEFPSFKWSSILLL